MLHGFECYEKIESYAGDQTQWEKKYDDGSYARLLISDKRITRQKVKDAFREQEFSEDVSKSSEGTIKCYGATIECYE